MSYCEVLGGRLSENGWEVVTADVGRRGSERGTPRSLVDA